MTVIPDGRRFTTPAVGGGTSPIAAERLISGGTWEGKVGVEGGIPSDSWQQNGSTVTLGANATTNLNNINAAIDAAAGSNQYVLLPAGSYNVAGAILLDRNGVELRGAVNANGVPTTILTFTASGEKIILRTTGWDISNSSQFTRRNVTSGGTRGSTSVVLASAPTGLVDGQMAWFTNPSPVGDGGLFDFYGTDSYGQAVRVTDINVNTVTFEPALNADYLTGTSQFGWRAQSASLTRSGIRNLSLLRSGVGGHYLWFQGTDECWAVNIKTFDVPSSTYHAYLYANFRTEIRHCDFSHMSNLTNSTYCIYVQFGTGLLIEDNYFHDAPNIMPFTGMVGSAFAYNYITDLPYDPNTFMSQIVFHHGIHNTYNLFEGNWLAGGYHDSGGSMTRCTWLRNRMRGYDDTGPKSGNTKCLGMEAGHDKITYCGNVLGENGHHTLVNGTHTSADDSGTNHRIYSIHTSITDTHKLGNYNTVDDAVPAGEALGAGEAVPTSLLHSTKPAWFSSLPWPWVLTTNFTQSNTNTNLPAGYRAVNGVDP